MSVEQKLTDKNVVSTTAIKTATKNSNSTKHNNANNKKNHSSKKHIKKALKISKSRKTNTAVTNVNNDNKTASINNSNNTNKYGNNDEDDCSSSSNSNNNKTEVSNDEIIEELFDFSDSDLKELGASNKEIKSGSNNNHSSTSGQLGNKENNILKEKTVEVLQIKNIVNDNNKNEEYDEKQQQVEEKLLTPIDNTNTDQQNKKDKKEELVIETMTPITNTSSTSITNMNSGNEVEEKIVKNQLQQQKQKNSKEIDSNNISPNKKDTTQTIPMTIPNSSIVTEHSLYSTEDDKTSSASLKSSPDIMSKQTNDKSSEFVNMNQENSYCGSSTNDNDMEDDEYIESGDELLVQFLDEANEIAEARLAARRHARAEAREIRMRELERQQKEQESNADRVFDMHTTTTGITPLSHMRLGLGSSPISGLLNSTRGNSMSSRRSSEDSLEEEGRSLRDIRHELKDVEERFRKAMIANAQLDNDRASQTYQIQLLKDKLEDMEESYAQLQRECKEKTRDCNALKRSLDKLSEELKLVQGQLNERDTLITEQGLVIVAIENEDGTDAKRALVSVENAQLLGSVQGSLDVRLKKFSVEKQQLQGEVQQLQEQLEAYRSQGKGRGKSSSTNGPLGSDDDDYEAQREANKIISDYKYKLQKAEQEIASLQSSLARSETQVIRYKSTAEAAEKAEAELKIERRKLQRENREAMEKLEELETSNNHLLKRLDKLKNAKSALLKDL